MKKMLKRARLSYLTLFPRWLFRRSASTKLFVGGLSYDTNETVLKKAFDEFGDIIEVKVICDRVSGKSKGYGFVQFDSENAASNALKEMNDKILDGRSIRIQYAMAKYEQDPCKLFFRHL